MFSQVEAVKLLLKRKANPMVFNNQLEMAIGEPRFEYLKHRSCSDFEITL